MKTSLHCVFGFRRVRRSVDSGPANDGEKSSTVTPDNSELIINFDYKRFIYLCGTLLVAH